MFQKEMVVFESGAFVKLLRFAGRYMRVQCRREAQRWLLPIETK